MNAADLFIKCLESEGVTHIFGIPGEENLAFLEALRKSKIELVLTRHEQGAGFMAATYGRLTGKAGVCLSTLGPGATNFFTPAAYAQLGAMPMVMITGQKPILKSKQGRFQIVDVVESMKPITKMARQIVTGSSIPMIVREGFRLAQEERPGAVHLELPEDIAEETVDQRPFAVHLARRPSPDPKALDKSVDMISTAQMPLVLIGAAANRSRIRHGLRAFLDTTGIYSFNTQMGKGVLDEKHPNFLGTAALSQKDYLHFAIEKADLIINIGHDIIEKPPFFMEHAGTKVIHINNFSANVDDVYFPQLEVIGDIAASMQALSKRVKKEAHWDFDYFKKVKDGIESHILEGAKGDRFPIIPQYLVSEVRKVMPSDGMIALDNGIYKIWFARNYKAYEPNTVLLDNALATMGAGLPSAMAAKLVHPDRKVMAICGDGGFMMNSQEIETALRMNLDLVIVILNDSGYGMIKWKQAGLGLPNFGLDYKNPDFVRYAESYGAQGHRVESAQSLAPILDKCLKSPGVHLIDVPVDYSENEKVLIDELNAKTSAF